MWKWLSVFIVLVEWAATSAIITEAAEQRLLYVATPGIRDYLEYGGHGLLVFDIDRGPKFVKRIPTGGGDEEGKPINVKGICASAETKRTHISPKGSPICLDMVADKLLWERQYDKGCDRMALSPDGRIIYQPSYEKLAGRNDRRRDRSNYPRLPSS